MAGRGCRGKSNYMYNIFMHRFGAHLSINGGYYQALEQTIALGGNCLQIFSSSPRDWQITKLLPQDKTLFINLKRKLKIDPVYFHASYLINLSDNSRIGHLSKQTLINELKIASELGITGSIIHLGSYKETTSNNNYSILIENIKEVLKNTPADSLFIIENAGNHKIGQTLDEIAQIVKELNDNRVKICLDTCHLFSTGYRWQSNEELNDFLNNLEKTIGLSRLELFHVNDSRDQFNSFHDRHENIGTGSIGIEEFQVLINHPKTMKLPFIIETPGFDKKGPDKKNLDILKSLVVNPT